MKKMVLLPLRSAAWGAVIGAVVSVPFTLVLVGLFVAGTDGPGFFSGLKQEIMAGAAIFSVFGLMVGVILGATAALIRRRAARHRGQDR